MLVTLTQRIVWYNFKQMFPFQMLIQYKSKLDYLVVHSYGVNIQTLPNVSMETIWVTSFHGS